jgi:UDP-N-acetylmuramate dehydrogenase
MELKIKGKVISEPNMKRYTSMKVGGPVRYLIYPESEEGLIQAIRILNGEGIKWRMFGNGTNVIISDKGLNEALIRITKLRSLSIKEREKEILVRVSGGYPLKRLILKLANLGVRGLENLYSIPGTVGGAVKMNAGSFGTSISDKVRSVKYYLSDGTLRTANREEIDFHYRRSSFLSNTCITEVKFCLERGEKESIMAEIERIALERKRRHPSDMPSSGSIFKAVNGVPAWRFIEKAGLKGLRIGDACVSEKHANFIVNLGKARAQDIKDLIDRIKKEVFEKEGIVLEEEVELWGFDA